MLAALAACAGTRVRVHRPGTEYVARLRIEGNHAIASDDLIPGLALHRTAVGEYSLDDYQLQLDTQRIATAYQKLGYFAVQVHARIEHQGQADTVVFTVIEGPRATVHVELAGLPPEVPVARARALVPLVEGGPFDYDAFDDARAALLQLVEDAGYAHAAVDGRVIADRAHAQATVEYAFAPGPRCTFGEVTITGATGLLADAVRARLAFHPGDTFSMTAVVDTQAALYQFGRFSSVRVRPRLDTDATAIPVRIAVAPGEPNDLRVGAGGGIDPLTFFARVHVAYTRQGFLTPLTTFTADLRPEYAFEQDTCGWDLWNCKRDPRVRLLGTLTQQDLGLTNLTGELELGVDYLTVEAYTRAGGHARVGLATPLGTPRVQLHVGWQYTYSDFVDIFVKDAAALGIDHPNYVGAYTGALVVDLRDRPIEPRRGLYGELRVARGTPYAGGDFAYWQVQPELRGFVTLGGTTIAARAMAGTIFGDVPETERYYGGGMSSQRGFAQRRLSPSDPATGIVVGGAAIVETGVELRHALGSPYGLDLGGVLFLDGADVTRTAAELDATNQHWAIGAGLRYLSPIGPIGLDVAYRLNRTGPGEPEPGHHWNVLLAVGEAF